jgi:phosphatidylinositol alpha-1,6-mannosyltransferase
MNNNILFFTNDYKPKSGGIAEYTYNIANNFSKNDKNVVVLAPKYGSEDKTFDKEQDFTTFRYTKINLIFKLIYILYKFKIEYIFNSAWYPCGFLTYFISKVFKIKFAIAVHGREVMRNYDGFKSKIKSYLKNKIQPIIFDNAGLIFAVSHFTKRKIIELNIKREKIHVINNGVDLNYFTKFQKFDHSYKSIKLKNKKILLTISRIEERKGHDKVIAALKKFVLSKFPETIYLIAGSGPYLNDLKQIVKQKRLEKNIKFLGFISEKEKIKLLKTCDIFIMNSRKVKESVEGFGIVFLEANACKKPVIGGNSGGIPDAISDGISGFLVNPYDEKDIGKKINILLGNNDLRIQLGEKGHDRIKRHFTWTKSTKKMIDLIYKFSDND